MKALRILAVAVMAMCFFGSAHAQVVVRARIGTPPPRHRVVVVNRGYHRGYYHRPYYRHHPVRRYHHRY
jgi:hypothetical protein